jgi:uncharacterized glyoxalase superfamily protein PhnB
MASGHESVLVPPRYSRVDPWVISSNTEAEIAFLETAFDAKETPGSRMLGPDGRIGHVEVEIGDAVIMLFDAQPDWPRHLRICGFMSPIPRRRSIALSQLAVGQSHIRLSSPSGSVWHGYAIHRATSGGYTGGSRMSRLPS